MAGLLIGLLYEGLSLQSFKDSLRNYIAVHSAIRMHSSYYQQLCECGYLCESPLIRANLLTLINVL